MHIRPVVRCDLGYVSQVTNDALITNELNLWLNEESLKYPHLSRERCLISNTRRFNSGHDQIVMVTDEDDVKDWDGKERIIGYAAYIKKVGAPDDSDKRMTGVFAAIERFLCSIEETYNYYLRNNLGTNPTRRTQFVHIVHTNPTWRALKKHWELDVLAVDPRYERRGIGGQLICWGKERATEDRVPLVLLSSVIGEPVYLRQGFREIDRVTAGDQGEVTLPVMEWLPETLGEEVESKSESILELESEPETKGKMNVT